MSPTILGLFCAALFLVSILYSCVGQAGASGYIAAMALFGLAPGTIKPTALVLNVLVSALVAFRFFRAGDLDWRTFWPLAIASIPAALLGGYLTLPHLFFNRLLGTLLLFFRKDLAETAPHPPGPVAASLAGSGIGLV